MVRALALYEGKTLNDFELIDITTDPEIIAVFVEMVHQGGAPVNTGSRQRRKLKVVHESSISEGGDADEPG